MRPSIAVEESVIQLGSNLRSARLRRRLPQSVVADRAGISLNTLSKIENGDCGVSIGNIASVLNALGLSPLLSGLARSARRLCRINAGRKESASASAFKKEICRAVT